MKTALYDRHVALGAKMAPFAGWEMPIQYKGVLAEHRAVRYAAGLFDVSHMGCIDLSGPDAELLLDYLSTNHIKNRPPNSATYTVWCDSEGKSIDDVMVFKLQDASHFRIVVNAGNRDKDLAHLTAFAAPYKVAIQDRFSSTGILALQGPKSFELLSGLYPQINDLKPMQLVQIDASLLISRTGYTGAGGFELFVSNDHLVALWDRLLQAGKPLGLEPAGLGARDLLRLEMGFALYGHELSDSIAPTESVSGWTVKLDKEDFAGKQALEKLEESGRKRHAYGIKMIDQGIPRQGYPIFQNLAKIGEVTSGSFSPELDAPIALILADTPLEEGSIIYVQIRQALSRAQIVKTPFVRKIG